MTWGPTSTFVFISAVIVVVYTIGVWIGTRLEKALEADRIKEAKKKEEEKKKGRRR